MSTRRGLALVELLLAIAILGTISVSALASIIGSWSTNRLSSLALQAEQYAQEGIEAARSLRNRGWSAPFLATNCTGGCGLSLGTGWSWLGASDTENGMTRVVTVTPAQRDGNGDFVASGGTPDSDAQRVESEVTWSPGPGRNNTYSLVTYLTNFYQLITPDWSSPSSPVAFDATLANSGNNTANAISIGFANNYAYLGRQSSGGRELLAIDVSNPSSPSLCANCQRELGGNVNDVQIGRNYAYMASSNNSQELQIISIADPSNLASAAFASVDLINSNSGNNSADAIALGISGTNLFMIRAGGNEFIRFDISNPLTPAVTGSNNGFTGTPTDMVVVGNYAYATSNDNGAELQIFNLSTLARDGTVNMNSGNNNADAFTVVAAGSSHILVGRDSSSAPELYVYELSDPVSPDLVDTVEIGADIYGLAYTTGYVFVSNTGTNDFQVFDASAFPDLATPAVATQDNANSPFEIIYADSISTALIASSSNSEELQIILP